MPTRTRSARTTIASRVGLVFAVLVASATCVTLASADVVNTDADLVTAGDQSNVALTIASGASVTRDVAFTLQCNQKKHVDLNETVTIDFRAVGSGSTAPAGGALSATNTSIGPIPASWPDEGQDCGTPAQTLAASPNSVVTITAPTAAGTYTYTAQYRVDVSTPVGAGTSGDNSSDVTGSGSESVTFTVTVPAKANQTITFPAIADKTYGDSDFAPGATASSGLPVSYSAAGNCSIVAGNVHIDAAGGCTVTASQPGNASYHAAPDVSRSFSIAKAGQTITFAQPASPQTYSASFAVSASASSGLGVAIVAAGVCSYNGATGSVTMTSGTGTCTLTASQSGNDNYNAAPDVVREVVAAKKQLTVTGPSPAAVTYGDTLPALEPVYDGFVGSDSPDSLTTKPTCALDPAYHGAGSYAVACSGGADDDYAFGYVDGALTVNRKPASVTPDAKEKTYGAEDPELTGTLEGFLAADGVTATYSRAAGESVAGGPYTISATLAPAEVLGNYDVTYNTADFTIARRDASVTPDAKSKTYGDDDPELTGTLEGFLAADGVTATYSRAAGESVAGGPYTISATLAPAEVLGNYDVTYNTASFTINRKAASVTPADNSKTYGDADPDPLTTGTLEGFLAVDGVSATYSRNAGESVAGSPYTISATLSPADVLGNYDITYNTAQFTIDRKAASVTPAANNKTYGDADPDPLTTGTLEGFLAADGVTATYSRAAGESVAGGPYTISATLSPADVLGNYDITYNTAQFTIDRKAASVTPADNSKTYGDADPDPLTTGTLEGFLAADGVTATYSRTAGESVAGGPYTISATLSPADALGNYDVAYNTASFTITPRAVAVKAADAEKVYGSPNPSFAIELFSGNLGGSDTLAVLGAPSFSFDPTPAVNAGSYRINVAGLSNTNYDIDYASGDDRGVFTITRKSASVSPAAATKEYGDDDPALTGTLSGFLAGDGVTASYSRTAGETVAGGPYTISATLAPAEVLVNYDVTYNTAEFTITRAPLSAQADDKTKLLNAPNPPFTGTLTGVKNNDPIALSFSTTATAASPVGSYPIVPVIDAAAEVLANYETPVLTNGTLKILFAWNGFRQPINDTAHQTGVNQSKFRLGQTIPAKFVLADANGVVVQQSPSPTFSRSANRGPCDSSALLELLTEVLPPDTDVAYKWDGSQYHYNWSTKGLTAGVYRIFANLADGTKRYVDICLTK